MSTPQNNHKVSTAADVALNVPANGQVLSFDDATKTWQNRSLISLPSAPMKTPEQFGAVGNGTADDQTALQNWLNALGPGVVGKVTANKTYYHSNMLTVSVNGTTIDGLHAIFIGTTEQVADDAFVAFRITADNVTIENLTVKAKNVTKRYVSAQSSLIWLDGCGGFVGRHITSENSPSAGIISYGGHDALLEDAIVIDSWADGIHWSGGSHNIIVRRPVVRNPGDDGVAVVSYYGGGAEPICHDIWVESPRVWGQNTNGRGVTVIGGRDITYTDVETYDTSGSGIHIATEFSSGSYYIQNVSNVRVMGGKVVRANKNSAHDLGAIMLFTEKPNDVMTNVLVSDIIVEDTRLSASGNIRAVTWNGASFSNCVIQRIMIRGSGPDTDISTNVTPTPSTLVFDVDSSYRSPMERALTADITTTNTTPAFANGLLFYPTAPGTYELIVQGAYRSSSTSDGPRFGFAGNVYPGAVLATITQTTSATATSSQNVNWALTGGANPSAANTDFAFTFRGVVDASNMSIGGTLGLMWSCSSSSTTATIRAGTHATLRRVA